MVEGIRLDAALAGGNVGLATVQAGVVDHVDTRADQVEVMNHDVVRHLEHFRQLPDIGAKPERVVELNGFDGQVLKLFGQQLSRGGMSVFCLQRLFIFSDGRC